jgi:hypothetical protein
MKRKTVYEKLVVAILFLFGGMGNIISQTNTMNTVGEVTFTVKTVTYNGNYAPKHVQAIWVEDDQGFVKTSLLRASQRKQYLYTWRSVSGDNVTDAVTGATLTSHQSITVIWNCTDIDGNIVPDGEYTVHVEFTEKHAQGPLISIPFTKSTEEQHLLPPDETNFIDMSLDYIPETAGIGQTDQNYLQVYPNPGNGIFHVCVASAEPFDLDVYDITGNHIHHQTSKTDREVLLDLSRFKSGIYFVKIKQEKDIQIARIVKQ